MTYTDEELELIAINSIRNYLNINATDQEIVNKYSYAFKTIYKAIEEQSERPVGVSSVTQGSQSITYSSSSGCNYITEDVKALLPKPFIKAY